MEIKKMTLEEAETTAKQEIKRLGGYNKYRQQSMDIPSDTEGGLLSHAIEYELKKHGGYPAALFRERPDLYRE